VADESTSDDPVVEQARQELERKLAALRRSNEQKYRALVRQGAVPTSESIIMTRLETLLAMLLDGDARLAFDLRFEAEMTELLNRCLTQARQRHLTAPAADGPVGSPPVVTRGGLILPR
jgi:AcrR family transcriptional regulator